jgi:hypothetical protein
MSAGIDRQQGGGLETRVAELERKSRGQDAVIASMGTLTLTADGVAVSTVKADPEVTTSSAIFVQPTSSAAWSVDGMFSGITLAAGQFTVSHVASSLARTYTYIVVNAV